MPITSSAKKALRQGARRNAVNAVRRKVLKNTIKAFKKNPNAENLRLVYKKLDKAAKVNIIKNNTAARMKSRLSKKLAVKK